MEALFNRWGNLVAKVRNDIVFEGKNKQYGAYYLRRNHNKNMAFSLAISSTLFFAIASFPAILDYFEGSDGKAVPDLTTSILVTLPTPPKAKPIEIPKEIPQTQPKKQILKTVKFTEYKAEDNATSENIDLDAIKNDTKIGTETQNGIDNTIEIPDNTKSTEIVETKKEEAVSYVADMPNFPGGVEAMNAFISKNVVYPQIEKEMGISGRCFVSFIVEKDGSITNIQIVREVADGPGYSQSSIDVIKKMPKWSPGRQNGRLVRVQFVLPINYTL